MDLISAVGGFFVSMLRELSMWVLRKELGRLELEIADYQQLNRELQKRFATSIRCMLPIGVVAKIISYLPDPNSIGNKPELRVDKQFVLTGDYTKIVDEAGRWWFEVKFVRLKKVSDEKINLEVSLRNNLGYCVINIPATKESFSGVVDLSTWVWNIYESGIVALTDDTYSFIYKAGEAWYNVQRDLIYGKEEKGRI